MIFVIEKAMQSTLWLAKIEEAECLGKDSGMLSLGLVGAHDRATRIILDEDSIARHLYRAVGGFDDPAEIIGKRLLVVLDQMGNVAAFYTPTEFDCENDALAPPPPAVQAWRDRQGRTWSEVGPGPKFTP